MQRFFLFLLLIVFTPWSASANKADRAAWQKELQVTEKAIAEQEGKIQELQKALRGAKGTKRQRIIFELNGRQSELALDQAWKKQLKKRPGEMYVGGRAYFLRHLHEERSEKQTRAQYRKEQAADLWRTEQEVAAAKSQVKKLEKAEVQAKAASARYAKIYFGDDMRTPYYRKKLHEAQEATNTANFKLYNARGEVRRLQEMLKILRKNFKVSFPGATAFLAVDLGKLVHASNEANELAITGSFQTKDAPVRIETEETGSLSVIAAP